MTAGHVFEKLFLCGETEAAEAAQQMSPDYVIDLRAEAEQPLQGAVSKEGTVSFALINGGPTPLDEMKRAIAFTAEAVKNNKSAVLH
ncbi:hypothetical protein ATL39_0264 [Sinobaca qinghaiensis]|uniref:Rhodanese-like domain-containing protein n=1 Tax=Sinobaca qinghaiensis TaxID=342944 RepID=A0A419V7M6_9BACL|nr:hypothetical protein [Sinobaca qinghaiensis]RKD76052.1 hypothetical protein ATL39_0264 [Sinobaca qinghaiensis]